MESESLDATAASFCCFLCRSRPCRCRALLPFGLSFFYVFEVPRANVRCHLYQTHLAFPGTPLKGFFPNPGAIKEFLHAGRSPAELVPQATFWLFPKSSDRACERSIESAIERANDGAIKRSSERVNDRGSDCDRLTERSSARSSDRANDRTIE